MSAQLASGSATQKLGTSLEAKLLRGRPIDRNLAKAFPEVRLRLQYMACSQELDDTLSPTRSAIGTRVTVVDSGFNGRLDHHVYRHPHGIGSY